MSVLNSIAGNEFARHLGIEFIEIDSFHAKASIPADNKLKNPYSSMHGGVLYSFADIVCGSLACMCGKYCATVSGSMNYIEPGIADKYFYCEARVIKSGAHMVYVDCEIKSDLGKTLDTASFTFYKTDLDA